MAINAQEVRRIATLARLRLHDDEIASLATDLTNILAYVEKLSELDTSGVEPTTIIGRSDVSPVAFRDDVSPERDPQQAAEDAVRNAPRRDDHFFAVPPIIE